MSFKNWLKLRKIRDISAPLSAQVQHLPGAGPPAPRRRCTPFLAQVRFLPWDLRHHSAPNPILRRKSPPQNHTCANNPAHLRQQSPPPAPRKKLPPETEGSSQSAKSWDELLHEEIDNCISRIPPLERFSPRGFPESRMRCVIRIHQRSA